MYSVDTESNQRFQGKVCWTDTLGHHERYFSLFIFNLGILLYYLVNRKLILNYFRETTLTAKGKV